MAGSTKGFYMKNAIKLIGIIAVVAVIGLSMTGCPEDDGEKGGTLTITGLGDYNDNYAYAISYKSGYKIIAAKSVDVAKDIYNGGKISGGKVTLNVYKISNDGEISDFTGSDRAEFTVLIFFKETDKSAITRGYLTVTFEDGSAEEVFVKY
jgi:hypothetical protein